MFRLFHLLSLALLVSRVLAAPACSRKNSQTPGCIQVCKSNLAKSGGVVTPTSGASKTPTINTPSSSAKSASNSSATPTITSKTTSVLSPLPETASPSSGGTSPSDIQAYLTGHNSVRAQHGAADLTWSDNLASKAQQWADGCKFQHSGGSLGPYGGRIFVIQQPRPGYAYILLCLQKILQLGQGLLLVSQLLSKLGRMKLVRTTMCTT